jgi:hypothetical protein
MSKGEDSVMSNLNLNQIANALGGQVRGNRVEAPWRGKRRSDRSLHVWILADRRRIGVKVHRPGVDQMDALRYVESRCGIDWRNAG